MLKEIKISKAFSIKALRPIADNEKLHPAPQLDYETYYVFEEEKPKPLPPENIELAGIPFFTISPRKIKFDCPKCKKTIYAMAQLNRQESKVDCEINFCFNCGQEFDWRIDNE